MTPNRPRRFLLIVTAALAVAAAATHASPGSSYTEAADPPPPSLELKCGDTNGVRGRALWLHASDGQRLYAVDGGSGRTGIVLVPESPPGDVCGWLPYMATLERAGLRVTAIDYRGTGDSPAPATLAKRVAYGRDVAAAIAHLRDSGATKVIVIGASFGGVVAMMYGAEVRADAIVSLSGETKLPEYHVDALAAMPRLRAPLLIVGTRNDSYLPISDALRLLRATGSADKRTMFFPGSWHGWEIVEDAPYASKARALVLAWLRARG